jgi:NAD(P)-dependent dehydrogenase (short-subunit alcohol dehydrogenase family)
MRDTAGRNASRMAEAWAEEASIDLCTADLDVVSQDSADTAVRQIVTECGRLHLVAHNAGPLTVGPTAAFSTEKIAGCSTPTCSVPTGSTGVPRHRVGGAQRQGALRSWQSKANHYTTHLGRSGQL